MTIIIAFVLQLTLQYKEKRKQVDDMKDDLQKRISDYSKLAENGEFSDILAFIFNMFKILLD